MVLKQTKPDLIYYTYDLCHLIMIIVAQQKLRPFSPQHNQDWLEYSEESQRPKKTCCHSNCCERSSTNAGVKNLQVVK